MGRVDGKVVLLTGGAGGIGSATARTLIAEGAQVVIADLNLDAAQATATALGAAASAVHMDAGDVHSVEEAVLTTVARHGRIDVLLNNAAVTDAASMAADTNAVDIDFALFDRVMAINVRGYLAGCKFAIPHMLKNGGGSIINTASGAGLAGHDVWLAYGCSKAAIIQLTRSVATAFGKQGIRCNAIAPYVILTEGAKAAFTPELIAVQERQALTPYLGSVEDMAYLTCFLASDESRFITGQVINCDGGLLAHHPFVADMREFAGRPPAG